MLCYQILVIFIVVFFFYVFICKSTCFVFFSVDCLNCCFIQDACYFRGAILNRCEQRCVLVFGLLRFH